MQDGSRGAPRRPCGHGVVAAPRRARGYASASYRRRIPSLSNHGVHHLPLRQEMNLISCDHLNGLIN
jgi:hypothetical protein